MVTSGDFQSTSSAGFIFGAVVAPLLVVLSVAWLFLRGRAGNDAFALAKGCSWRRLVLGWRLLLTTFYMVTVVLSLYEGNVSALSYFTIWNLIVLLAYFGTAFCVSMIEVFSQHGQVGKVLLLALQILGELELSTSWLVSIVVWGYLAPFSTPTPWIPFLDFTSIATHLCSSIVMTIDFFLAGYLINGAHWAIVLMWPALYVCWHLAGNAAWGIMCYPFMATDDPAFIGWVIGLALLSVGLFGLAFLLSKLKRKLLSRYSEILLEQVEDEGEDEKQDSIGAAKHLEAIASADPAHPGHDATPTTQHVGIV